MTHRRVTPAICRIYRLLAVTLLFGGVSGDSAAQPARPWTDPSPHSVRHIVVSPDVQLEVLDWGGPSEGVDAPALVFLTGIGNTAHVYDDFAPRLRDRFHVYALTRRGFGTSSAPLAGYDAATRAHDIVTVLDSLGVDRALLAGHSLAGDELSKIGVSYPQRVRALVYLDAFDFPPRPAASPSTTPTRSDTAASAAAPDPEPTTAELASPTAFLGFVNRVYPQWIRDFPDAEKLAGFELGSDGHIIGPRPQDEVREKIWAGTELADFRRIAAPALGIFFLRPVTGAPLNSAQAAIARFRAGLPSATVIELPDASHYVFLSQPDAVERAMRVFLARTR